MSRVRSWVAFLALPSLVGFGCGSGDGLPRQPISGTVALDGRPLDGGRIEFQPVGPGVATGAAIEQGSYRVAREAGPTPGRYRVNISSPVETGGPSEPEGSAPGRGQPGATERIPARYNASSTLTVEVKANSTDPIDFTLDSSSPKDRKR